MARPIKMSPTVRGKDSVRLNKALRQNEAGKNKVSKEERSRIFEIVDAVEKKNPHMFPK